MSSARLLIVITSISGMIDASRALFLGIKIRLNHFSFAHIVAGKILGTCFKVPSSESSQRNMESLIRLSSTIYPSERRIQTAIPTSKLGQVFLIFAGARLTVIRVVGSFA